MTAAQYAVHIGLKADNVHVIHEHTGRHVITDGDGWNCWGDKPGVDVNDTDTLHAILGPFETDRAAFLQARKITEQRGEVLEPMAGYPQQTGIKAVVTSWDDWSIDLLLLS